MVEKKRGKKEKKRNYSKQGKRNRAAGARFERKVRKDLEDKGYVVDKWTNNIYFSEDTGKGKLAPAKRKYNPFLRALSVGTGFPDFLAIKNSKEKNMKGKKEIIGVEVKRRGYLSKVEKKRCRFYLNKTRIFSKILIAKAIKDGRKINIEYIDFKKKYGM